MLAAEGGRKCSILQKENEICFEPRLSDSKVSSHEHVFFPQVLMPVCSHRIQEKDGKRGVCLRHSSPPQHKCEHNGHSVFYLFLQLCNFLLVLCLKPLQLDS